VRHFGVFDSPEARESVFRFRRPSRACVGGVGCEGCRVNAPGEGRGFELAPRGGGVMTTAARAPAGIVNPLSGVFEDLSAPSGLPSIFEGFSSSLSFGRRDSVEPLFLRERTVGGRSLSVRRASSTCRKAICPLSSSSLEFHSGIDVHRVLKASTIEKVAILNLYYVNWVPSNDEEVVGDNW